MSIFEAHHFLDQKPDFLIVIQQVALLPVGEGVWRQPTGIDLADGGQQGREALVESTLVAEKDALVLAGEGRLEVVFQESAGAHNEGLLAQLLQQSAALRNDVSGELAIAEDLLHNGEFVSDLLGCLVFLVLIFGQAIEREKILECICTQEVRLRNSNHIPIF